MCVAINIHRRGCVLKRARDFEKICLTYFKIGQTYFEIGRTYFSRAPMVGKEIRTMVFF